MTFSADLAPALVVMDYAESLEMPNSCAMCEGVGAARPRRVFLKSNLMQ